MHPFITACLPWISHNSNMVNEKLVRKTRVLIVDDNEDAAELVASMLSILDFDVKACFSGASALEAAPSFQPEVIFLDLGMPQMSGFEVAVKLRKIAGLEAVYVAALTGWGDTSTRSRTSAAGFDAHIQKPAQMEQLLDVCMAADRSARMAAKRV